MYLKSALIALVATLVSVQATTDSANAADPSKIVFVENSLGSGLPISMTNPVYADRHYRYPTNYYGSDTIRPYYNTYPDRLYRRSDDGAASGAETGQSKAAVGTGSDEAENEKFLMFPYYGYRRFYNPFFYRRPYIFL